MTTKRIYYIVGPPGVGKSKVCKEVSCDHRIPEWFSDPVPLMYRDPRSLSPHESELVDEWILSELSTKITELNKISGGVVLVDRSPVDMVAFATKFETMQQRASRYLKLFFGEGQSSAVQPVDGMIVHLYVEPTELSVRRKRKSDEGKPYTSSLKMARIDCAQDNALFGHYEGVINLDATKMSIEQCTKSVAHIVNKERYSPISFHDFLVFLTKSLNI